jgi:hypothetical protein
VRPLYLFGKYEVTNAQYRAVMNGDCQLQDDSARPVVSVSFYDAVRFTRKMNEHLLANSPQSLPRSPEGNIGAVRLPTEEEWEYAARGGHYVKPEELTSNDFFPFLLGGNEINYGFFKGKNSLPQRNPIDIGTYRPNPAGIYDTIGNAAEYVYAPFRMTLGSRLHGSAGGPLTKGGSFRNESEEVASGARLERPFYQNSGPGLNTDIGFRVMISSPNLGSPERLQKLEDDYSSALKADPKTADLDPVLIAETLAASAKTDDEKQVFGKLRDSLAAYSQSAAERRQMEVRSYIWSLIYNIMGIRTNSMRILTLQNARIQTEQRIRVSEGVINDPKADPEAVAREKGRLPGYQKTMEDSAAQIREFDEAYKYQRRRYNNLLLQSDSFPKELLFEALDYVRGTFTGDDSFTTELKRCYEPVARSLDFVVSQGGNPENIDRKDLEIQVKLQSAAGAK